MNASSMLPGERGAPDEMERLLERYRELLSGIAQGEQLRTLSRGIAETVNGLIGMAAELLRAASEACDTPPGDSTDPAIETLTGRERDVLRHVLAGRASREIAQALQISPSSVTKHRTRLMAKLRARRATELVRRALELGLRDDNPLAAG